MVGSGVIYSGGQQCQSTFGFFGSVKQKKIIHEISSENVSIKQIKIKWQPKKTNKRVDFLKNLIIKTDS